METVNRKVRYQIYPSAKQRSKLEAMLVLHQRLYNCALERRIGAYQKDKTSIGFKDQCKELTELRKQFPEYAELNAQSEQVTLKRLDRAYQNFFRRVKNGEKTGFPRFKSLDRFKGWGYKNHGDGWRFFVGNHGINGYLRLSGVGHLQARGRGRKDDITGLRTLGEPKTMEIIHKNGKWFASVTFKRPMPRRLSGDKILGIDWGTSKFLTIVDSFGNQTEIENPRLLKKVDKSLRLTQKQLSRKKKGSQNRKKAKKKVVRLHEKLAAKRQDHLHKASASLVRISRHIATEKLNIKNMTACGGDRKAGLNRSILDTSPGDFFQKLRYKAEEAGIQWSEIPTRKVKPSQTCACCGVQEKKHLSMRIHDCINCGFKTDRDVNAALVMINYALTSVAHSGEKVTGQELALGVESGVTWMLKHETPPIPEHAR